MKLPAVAITAAFAGGVVLGLCPTMGRLATSPLWLAAGFLAATLLITTGMIY